MDGTYGQCTSVGPNPHVNSHLPSMVSYYNSSDKGLFYIRDYVHVYSPTHIHTNCEKRPKQERDDIRFTHIAIPTCTSFCNIEVCVLLEHVLISYTGGVRVLPMGVGSKFPRGGSPVKACVG